MSESPDILVFTTSYHLLFLENSWVEASKSVFLTIKVVKWSSPIFSLKSTRISRRHSDNTNWKLMINPTVLYTNKPKNNMTMLFFNEIWVASLEDEG